MAVYYLLFALILGLAYPLCVRNPSPKKKLLYVAVTFGYLFFLSVFRYGIGNDYFSYRSIFYNFVYGNTTWKDLIKDLMEPGYILLMKIVSIFTVEYTVFNGIVALLILLPTAYIIYRYSKNVWLSTLMYVCITFFYNSINFTRQSLSVAIIFLGYRFFRDKKHIPAVLVILAAGMFHYTSLVMLPIYFLSVLIKPNVKSLCALSAVGALIVVFSERILHFVVTYILPFYSVYEGTQYVTRGLSKSYLIVPAFLLILIGAAYFLGWRKKSEYSAVLMSFMFYSFFIWIFVTKHFILERFSMPVYIFTLITVPEVLDFYREYFDGKGAVKLKGFFKRLPKSITQNPVHKAVYAVLLAVMLIYNDYCAASGVHGVFPYHSLIQAIDKLSETQIDRTLNYRDVFIGDEYYEFLTKAYNHRERYTIIAVIKGYASGNPEEIYDNALVKLGAETRLNDLDGKSCVMGFANGESFLNIVSDDLISEEITLYDGKVTLQVVSGGVNAGDTCEIILNGTDYSVNAEGVNFIVFDNYLEKMIDAHGYDLRDWNLKYYYTSKYIF